MLRVYKATRARVSVVAAGSETELKFLFAENDLPKVAALIASYARAESHQRLYAVYFDTPRHDLWNHGLTLRVRATGKSYRQGIKRIVSSSITRDELEQSISGPSPDLENIKISPLAGLKGKSAIVSSLLPVFEVGAERASYSLDTTTGLIEGSIDCGAIKANGATLGICELELELKSGAASDLFNLAQNLVSQATLHPSTISKAERGYLLAKGAWGRAAKGSRPRLAADMPRQEAFQEICRTCLHDFHLNVPAIANFAEIEGVHQGRVALRRLRAAMTLFKPMIFDISYRRLSSELKWLAGLLGAGRDLDILQANFPQGEAIAAASSWETEHLSRIEARRIRARRNAIDSLESERGRTLFVDLLAWIENGPWQTQFSRKIEEPILAFARGQLKKRLAKLVKRDKDLVKLDTNARHEIRIDAKKLRYMAEFFLPIRGVAKQPEQYKLMINCCEKLQEAIGAIRDEEARAEFMQSGRWPEDWSPDTRVSTAGPDHLSPRLRLQTIVAKNLRKAVKAYSKLAVTNPF
jgi:triphosphatase